MRLEGQYSDATSRFVNNHQGTSRQVCLMLVQRRDDEWPHVIGKNVFPPNLKNARSDSTGQCERCTANPATGSC